MKFYKCNICDNIVMKLYDSGIPVKCCGRSMEELVPGTVDAALEKHVPVYRINGCEVLVKVGSDPHPMTEDHYIMWIALETNRGIQVKELKPGDFPCACFRICEDDAVIAVYEYCNLHGLWKT